MAGMEQVEIHSRSYLVRWVNVKAEHTISWSIRPDKKGSINFGIYKHPGSGHAPIPSIPSSTFELPPTPGLRPEDASQEPPFSKNPSSTATEKLKSIGLILISWHGTCEANRVSTGTYDVPCGEGGMYALVFDNTFAKSFAKSATFVLLTYATKSPPQSNYHMHHNQGTFSESMNSLKETLQPRRAPMKRESSESVKQVGKPKLGTHRSSHEDRSKPGSEISNASNFFTGVLQKRRRKKHQGWARRFFSLDYSSSTLSYYQNRNSRAVRGAVPLSLAAIGTNAKARQISVDSGAEIWHLKAGNQKDFEAWKDALELAKTTTSPATPATSFHIDMHGRSTAVSSMYIEEEKDWSMVEEIMKRVQGSRDMAKSLAKDTDPKYLALDTLQPPVTRTESNSASGTSSPSESPSELSLSNTHLNGGERRPFWKRKPSGERPMPGMYRSVSATPSSKSLQPAPPTPNRTTSFAVASKPLPSHIEEEGLHDRCMSLLRDLDAIVADFNLLDTERKQRRTPMRTFPISRHSIDTQGTDEFFDAMGPSDSQLLAIHHDTDEEGDEENHGFNSDEDSASGSDAEAKSQLNEQDIDPRKASPAFPSKPKSLVPLPAERIRRRNVIPPPAISPPSLVGIFRKNVGKDLSTVSMPVSTNEPISLLQRICETLEYSNLLNDAATKFQSTTERLISISAFAISNISGSRVKERAIRKPFNPMLGETFELVREDQGFRLISEKVSHRPVRLACQAESEKWTLTQSPLPTQKFWGKSMELVTEGKFRVVLHTTGDRFSWNAPTSFLRNMIAGEKYVEPVGNVTVSNEVTGEKAVVTFKSKGMFSGRSEEVVVQTFDAYGDELSLGLVGKWTTSLAITEHGNPRSNEPPIWMADELGSDASKVYGFTPFAISLNEITALEQGKLPPTDSRLRPDQRAAEEGDYDKAESLKVKLEEAQRERRKHMEETSVTWTPKWFEKIEGGDGGEEVWVAKHGKESYWEHRAKGNWEGVEKIFEIDTT